MPAIKRIPQRRCVGCGISKNKNELIRVVRSPGPKETAGDGVPDIPQNKQHEISIDLKGKKSGRGAYICKDETCLKKAAKAKKFDRSLETKITDDILESLLEQIKSD